ncbi:CRE-RIL-1 protein [Ditylenchus destructor]|uniref:CRE-RIL-1 protein n=1 Tax=Ditylenchus destructor TaxID=166010 RepID=A0AAD4R153_9BILA|nr:CRE-RIL-1 protein [Ditylenchus destructor]
MVLSKVYGWAKWTGETVKGAAREAVSKDPIPPTKMHPRMMAWPLTPQQWFRMLHWRFHWQYHPQIRMVVLSAAIYLFVSEVVFKAAPHKKFLDQEAKEKEHKHELDTFHSVRQKEQDKIYFQKHDPLKHTRPHAYDMVYGKGAH